MLHPREVNCPQRHQTW